MFWVWQRGRGSSGVLQVDSGANDLGAGVGGSVGVLEGDEDGVTTRLLVLRDPSGRSVPEVDLGADEYIDVVSYPRPET